MAQRYLLDPYDDGDFIPPEGRCLGAALAGIDRPTLHLFTARLSRYRGRGGINNKIHTPSAAAIMPRTMNANATSNMR